MSALRFTGPVWTFGNDVDTDQIVPGHVLNATVDEQAKHAFEAIRPEFSRAFAAGGILVAGRNFGCGSSRESAPDVLKHLGVAAVVATSFARIFFRNAIAIGLPVLICPGVAGRIADGEELTVDVMAARVTLATSGEMLPGERLNNFMLACLRKGGILALLPEAGRVSGEESQR